MHINLQTCNNEEYEIKSIWDNTIFVKKLEANHLLNICFLDMTIKAFKSLH